MAKVAITVYVGDVGEYLEKQAHAADSTAILITNVNYSNLQPGTYYVSIGDLESDNQLVSVLLQADNVIYALPLDWSSDNTKIHTEKVFSRAAGNVPIRNFAGPANSNLCTLLELNQPRQSNNQQLWVAGCSVTAGDGVELNERYGQLLADHLSLPITFLAKSGSSLIWQADQILRSDIRLGDIVVWGLTNMNRFPYYINRRLIHANAATIDRVRDIVDIDVFDSDDLLYRTIIEVYKVINFCRKINAKLILANMISNELPDYINTNPEFINLVDLPAWGLIDLGSDNRHPGKEQHKFYSRQLLKKINTLYGELK